MATTTSNGKTQRGRSGWQRESHESENGAFRDAEKKVQDAFLDGKVSNRRYRRWVNDRVLRELVPAMDAQDIGGLFAPPPWGDRNYQTTLELLTETGACPQELLDGWEPFRNDVNMDDEAKFLGFYDNRSPIFGRKEAVNAWLSVDRDARRALRRSVGSPMLPFLEGELMKFLEYNGRELILEVPTAYHRLLLHGLSQFHGLSSQSQDVGETTQVCITKRRSSCKGSAGRVNLYQFLQEVKRPSAVVA